LRPAGGKCRRRVCPGYFRLYAGDLAALIRENMDHVGGAWDLLTITPPGADILPWDRSKCTHPPGVRCSGLRGCVVEHKALALWHRNLAPNLDRLLRAAKERLRRRGYLVPRIIRASPETQERGALHYHLAAPTADRRAFYVLYEQIAAIAPNYGFGRSVSWDPSRGMDRADSRGLGAYITKLSGYVSKEAQGEARGLLEVLKLTRGMRAVSVSPKITVTSRVTMRNLRARRFLHCKGVRGYSMPDVERVCAVIREAESNRPQASRPPPTWVPPWRDDFVIALGAAGVDVAEVTDAPTLPQS
jgi:hypothetical protein